MRKSVLVAAGFVTAAVLAVAGITSANAAARPATAVVPATRPTSATTISQADAERIALATLPGSTATETHLDSDNGRAVWNVYLSTSGGTVEVKVDAETGEVRAEDAVDDDSSGVDDDGQPGSDDGADDHTNGQNGHGDDDPAGQE